MQAGQHQPDSLAALVVAHDVLVHPVGQRSARRSSQLGAAVTRCAAGTPARWEDGLTATRSPASCAPKPLAPSRTRNRRSRR
ncbi:hypothetical protein FR943_10210 [Mycobacterium sp. TNTM28]|uniref:Uncharacterized protein n=1 Tax=[Mycobacterium] fortunisiensis TaxID=2600579 RepID=A0ABS6KKV0_9MYCO|nr:hypothetical protein [[Mycobacterium] fortunisiensis]